MTKKNIHLLLSAPRAVRHNNNSNRAFIKQITGIFVGNAITTGLKALSCTTSNSVISPVQFTIMTQWRVITSPSEITFFCRYVLIPIQSNVDDTKGIM